MFSIYEGEHLGAVTGGMADSPVSAVKKLLMHGVITPGDARPLPSGEVTYFHIDSQRARDVIGLINPTFTRNHLVRGPEFEERYLNELARSSFRESLAGFIESGLVVQEEVDRLRGFCNEGSIFVHKTGGSQFTDDRAHSGSSGDRGVNGRAIISIGGEGLNWDRYEIESYAYTMGIPISEDQALRIAMRRQVSHETGHALHWLIERTNAECRMMTPQQWALEKTSEIAPDPVVEFIRKSEKSEPGSFPLHFRHAVGHERIASGFAGEDFLRSVVAGGVEKSDALKLTEMISAGRKRDLKAFLDVAGFLEDYRMDSDDLDSALSALRDELRDLFPQQFRIPDLPSFGVGYFTPLNSRQLFEFMRL